MASHTPDFGRAPALPLRRALALIQSLPRPMLSRVVARAIERLDAMDGDPDLEDATNAEDEGLTWLAGRYSSMNGAGCPVSDPGGGNVEDERQLDL